MFEVTVTMQLAKQTPNTYMYRELDDAGIPIENPRNAKIGSLYVKKNLVDAPGAKTPDKIQVSVKSL